MVDVHVLLFCFGEWQYHINLKTTHGMVDVHVLLFCFGEWQYHINIKRTHGMVDVAIQHIPQNTRYGGYIGVVFAWVWAASLGIRSVIELAKGVEEMVMLIINWGSQVKYYFCQWKWWRRCVIIAKVCDFEDVCIACWNCLGHCFVVDSESFYPR